jgi:hypothetical protein
MSKSILILFSVFITLFLVVLITFIFSDENKKSQVIIINTSSQKILFGEIEVCNKTYKIYNICQGESKCIEYKSKYDSHYTVTLKFDSGKTIKKELGYVTNGMTVKDIIKVEDGDIVIYPKE